MDEVESRRRASEIRALHIKLTVTTPFGVWHSESQAATILEGSEIEVLAHSTRLSRHYVLKQVATEESEESEADNEYEEWCDEPDNPEGEP